MSEVTEDFLAHYGVKGMKWGKRSGGKGGSSSGGSGGGSKHNANTDAVKSARKEIYGDAKQGLIGKGRRVRPLLRHCSELPVLALRSAMSCLRLQVTARVSLLLSVFLVAHPAA